jgi:hypothetical protein
MKRRGSFGNSKTASATAEACRWFESSGWKLLLFTTYREAQVS